MWEAAITHADERQREKNKSSAPRESVKRQINSSPPRGITRKTRYIIGRCAGTDELLYIREARFPHKLSLCAAAGRRRRPLRAHHSFRHTRNTEQLCAQQSKKKYEEEYLYIGRPIMRRRAICCLRARGVCVSITINYAHEIVHHLSGAALK